MADQYVVPQFIDAEDKIFGPITARQFILLMITGLLEFIAFKTLPFIWFIVVGLLVLGVGVTFAFTKINGQPFHFFLLNLVQTWKKPTLRVWHKFITDAELQAHLKEAPVFESTKFQRKASFGSSRLEELSLVVNTGGVYKPDNHT